jgi:PAS domain S-box-containing protein
MFKEIKIGTKITFLLLTVVMTAVMAISYLSFEQSKASVEQRYADNFKVISHLKAAQIATYFRQLEQHVQFIGNEPDFVGFANQLPYANTDAHPTVAFIKNIESIQRYSKVLVTNKQGTVLFNSQEERPDVRQIVEDLERREDTETPSGIYYGNPFYKNDKILLYAFWPVPMSDDRFLTVEVNLTQDIFPMVEDQDGLGETGEIVLCHLSGIKVDFLNSLRHLDVGALTYSLLLEDFTSVAAQKAASGLSDEWLVDLDYRNKETMAYTYFIPGINWGLVVKMDKEEIDSAQDGLLITFLKTGGVILLISLMISAIFSKFLTNPLLQLKNRLSMLAKGDLPEKIEKKAQDEIGQMAYAVNELVGSLKRTAEFAHQIGAGNYEADFKPISDKDILGNALITMSESIQTAEKRDNERTWIVSGVAEIGQILRLHNNLEDLGDDIIGYITKKIEAIQGAFYTLNDDDEEVSVFEMKASFAYNKKKYLKASFRFAEGLVGQCAAEQDTILRVEIPDEYVTITSGLLGDRKPKALLLVPLITNEKVYGVLEFAGFERFNQTQISFVQEISVIVARTIFNIKVNERTVKLLQESQKMSEELQFQQEILRQNAEEMEATQEELRRTNHRLEDQIMEVNRTQKKLEVLLENASEVITIYEKDGKVRYVSPSVEPILGYLPEELIGHSDIDHVHHDSVDTFKAMFNDLLERPAARLTVQYEYKLKNGQSVWLEATGTNLLNDPAIQGVVINSRDITERRRAEKEERMRSQMQALSENSPDLIKRLNNEGIFFYINPVIKNLTGRNPEYFLSKSLDDIHINQDVKTRWKEIFQDVLSKKQKISCEMDFPLVNGETKIMQVNAIPEFSDHGAVESVLLVSHDITERKKNEIEIHNNNKKITESINYAKRIQTAILPDDAVISEVFPNSFILYKPRDVVSGDFPWFMQKGDDVYIAAVDCTGHGVPGALISLIGYFILNDVVNSDEHLETGRVLDLLNEGVTRTLRQDDINSTTRDGMDIALLRVNYARQEVEYAGANRLLYRYHQGELEQIKGNSFPIGGGQYKTRTHFTTHKLQLCKGDEFYVYSDGFPDQFGGNENKKFGNQRIREVIMRRAHQNMAQMKEIMNHEFESWKSTRKQTDDVLMIGIQF